MSDSEANAYDSKNKIVTLVRLDCPWSKRRASNLDPCRGRQDQVSVRWHELRERGEDRRRVPTSGDNQRVPKSKRWRRRLSPNRKSFKSRPRLSGKNQGDGHGPVPWRLRCRGGQIG